MILSIQKDSNTMIIDYRLRSDRLKDKKGCRRQALAETVISSLALPGELRPLVVTNSDEHDKEENIIEDAVMRNKMVEKRLLKKLLSFKKRSNRLTFMGKKMLSWGSTFGVIQECIDLLSFRYRISMLNLSELWPFPLIERFDYMKRQLIQGSLFV